MAEQNETLIAFGGNLKTHTDGNVGWVEGLGVMYGSEGQKDLEGDFFTPGTFYGHKAGDMASATLNHGIPMYSKNTKAAEAQVLETYARKLFKSPIRTEQTELGILARHALDLKDEYEAWVFEQTQNGTFKWSSGALSHLVERDDETGEIKRWEIGEFAYTPSPAEHRLPAISPFKSYQAAFTADITATETNQETTEKTAAAVDVVMDGQPVATETKSTQITGEPMTEQVTPVQEAAPVAPPVDVAAIAAQAAQEAVKAYQAKLEAEPVNAIKPAAKNVAVNFDTDIHEYDNIETGALALAASVVQSVGKQVRPSLFKAIGMRLEGSSENKGAMSVKSFNSAANAFKRFARGVKANELTYSTQSGAIDEWIGVAYSSELWDLIRNETMVLRRLGAPMVVPRGTESVTIPTLTGGVTFYKVAQATGMDSGTNPGSTTNTVTVSKQTGSNKSLTLAQMGAAVTWTGAVDHDSVVPYAEQLRRDIVMSGQEYLEAIFINGDTDGSATTNINDIGGTPAATDWFMVANGFRKSPLITTTANSRSAGSLTSADFLETVKLMGDGGRNALDTSKVSFIVDPSTHYAALQLADVKSRDVFSGATIENGRLTGIYGYGVDVSAEMHKGATGLLANTSGLVDLDTQGNNTTGSILAVRWDQWKWGHDGAMTIESERVPRADATEITALTRVGLVQRDTEASAISYNVTV